MKRTTSTLLATALLFGVTAVKGNAQGPTRNPFGTGELPEFLKPYDLNEDGKLSVEERQAYEKALREARPDRPGMRHPWDTDGDGVLSDEEKQAAREAVAAKMLENRTARFNELDADSDGLLTDTELMAIPRITATQVTRMIARLDKAGEDGTKDGMISLDEFLAAMKPVEPPLPPMPPRPWRPVQLPGCLKAFDADKDQKLSPEEFDAFIAAVDTDGDGKVSLAEWRAYVMANPELLPPPPSSREGPGGR